MQIYQNTDSQLNYQRSDKGQMQLKNKVSHLKSGVLQNKKHSLKNYENIIDSQSSIQGQTGNISDQEAEETSAERRQLKE